MPTHGHARLRVRDADERARRGGGRDLRHRDGRPVAEVWNLACGRSAQPAHSQRSRLRLAGAQRRRQEHDPQDAHDAAAADIGPGDRGRLRHRRPGALGARPHRLRAADALRRRRADRAGEPASVRGTLRHGQRRGEEPDRRGTGLHGTGRLRRQAGQDLFRRHDPPPGARAGHAAPARRCCFWTNRRSASIRRRGAACGTAFSSCAIARA